LRRQRFSGRHIARDGGGSPATDSRVLRHAVLSRLQDLEPVEPLRNLGTSLDSFPRFFRSTAKQAQVANGRGGFGFAAREKVVPCTHR
jgi:hypothetical protein